MKITNKDLIQSYVLTSAKYDFNVYEKRVLYRIIEAIQATTKGLKLNYNYTIQKDLFDNRTITFPMACFLNEVDKNYNRVKKALYSLREKTIEYEDSQYWAVYGIISSAKIDKNGASVDIEIADLLWGAYLNFSKGYRKYELKTAMEFDSIYAMRFYELLSGKTAPIRYSIEQLREMFQLQGKYKQTRDFIKRVVEPAKREMNAKAPTGFQYEPIKIGRSITHIDFKPFYNPKNRDPELERKELNGQISPRMSFSKELIAMLIEKFQFTEDGIKHNRELLTQAIRDLDFRKECSEIQGMIREYGIANPAGFFISQLKKKLIK